MEALISHLIENIWLVATLVIMLLINRRACLLSTAVCTFMGPKTEWGILGLMIGIIWCLSTEDSRGKNYVDADELVKKIIAEVKRRTK